MTKRTPPKSSRRTATSPPSKGRHATGANRKRAEPEEEERAPRSRRPVSRHPAKPSAKRTSKETSEKSSRSLRPKATKTDKKTRRRTSTRPPPKSGAATSKPAAKRGMSPAGERTAPASAKPPGRRATRVTRKSATLPKAKPPSSDELREAMLPKAPSEPPAVDSAPDTIPPVTARFQMAPNSAGLPIGEAPPKRRPRLPKGYDGPQPEPDRAAPPTGTESTGTSDPDTKRSRKPRRPRKATAATATAATPDAATPDAATPDAATPISKPPLVAGYDLDADEAAFVAPIGPTESYQSVEEEDPRETRDPERVEELEQQIRDLESRLDQMIGEAAEAVPAPRASDSTIPDARASDSDLSGSVTSGSPSSDSPPPSSPESGSPPEPPRDVVASHQYLQGWRQKAMRDRSEEVDDFGLDPTYEERAKPFLEFLHRHYFRVDVEGTRNIPSEGRCLIVGNHSGGPLPYDGLVLRTAVRREHPTHRELRWLAEDFIYYLPFVGTMMSRLGAVRACQENAERVLRKGGALLVFPEGEKGVGKLYRNRYRLQRFGRGGYVRLGLRTRTPIIPVAVVGAEEANPVLYRIEYMAKALGLPFLPVTPTFPALGPVGLLPAPTKWTIRFGEPITFDGYGPQSADDEILVRRLSDQVRGAIQGMLDRTLGDRRSIWFG